MSVVGSQALDRTNGHPTMALACACATTDYNSYLQVQAAALILRALSKALILPSP
jgi:hypothetical protein